MRNKGFRVILSSFLFWGAPLLGQREDRADHHRKWLEEDIVYIISQEEKEVFRKLQSDQEREHFIEQFWRRRDPTPNSDYNEYREEHYRRIAYANERFASGYAGWATDRGRIYIMYGPPAEIESHVSGGTYYRSFREGGGSTATYPFEIWRYRYLAGMGNNVEIEFVDTTFSGNYQLALSPEEKDAFLHIDGLGLKEAELLGLRDKFDRPYYTGSATWRDDVVPDPEFGPDGIFARLERYLKLQKPPEIQYRDLQQVVSSQVYYSDLPFRAQVDRLHLSDRQHLFSVTLLVDEANLAFRKEDLVFRSRVEIYGQAARMTGESVFEFEDVLQAAYEAGQEPGPKRSSSIYQKWILLGAGVYKLNLVVKDVFGNRLGTQAIRLEAPAQVGPGHLSSAIVARSIQKVDASEVSQSFVFGLFKVIPDLSRLRSQDDYLDLFLQVYRPPIDQATGNPLLELEFHIYREDQLVRKVIDPSAQSVRFLSPSRALVVKTLRTRGLAPGKYRIRVNARSAEGDLMGTSQVDFQVTG